jgi:hypothetical protein
MTANRWASKAADEIFSLFKNASYFSTRNAEHRAQMLEGWAQIIERNAADADKQEQPSELPADGCICRGNWREIVAETETMIGKEFVNEHDERFRLFGIVHADDDYYYGMHGESGMRLLSCVGNIESFGYRLVAPSVVEAAPAIEVIEAAMDESDDLAEELRHLKALMDKLVRAVRFEESKGTISLCQDAIWLLDDCEKAAAPQSAQPTQQVAHFCHKCGGEITRYPSPPKCSKCGHVASIKEILAAERSTGSPAAEERK